ncbi:21606_t:CDS:2 [Rhizophagus irregularis]|nr:21606_t:CDS:2 [Rhizophagus irregularis]
MPSPVHALLAARLSYMLQSWSNQLFVYSELDITAGNNKTPAPENEEHSDFTEFLEKFYSLIKVHSIELGFGLRLIHRHMQVDEEK